MLPKRFETFIRILALSALSFWLPTATRSPSSTPTPTPSPKLSQFTFPVKVGPTGRYLVDQKRKPWMLIADSAWTILSHFSPAQQATYCATRAAQGFTAVLFSIMVGPNEGGNAIPFSLLDGRLPFTGTVSVGGVTYPDISKPNPAYWAEIDSFIKLAGSYNLCAIPVATDTGNGQLNSCTLPTFRANGVAKCQAFGAFLGNRYKNFPNIIWQHGNDYNRTGNFNGQQPGDSHLMAAIINGIGSADNNHLHTLECDSGEPTPTCDLSSDDTTLYPLTDINEVYSYIPNYAPILLGYNLPSPKPVILGENGYEGQGLLVPDVRKQDWWIATSGAAGQFWGTNNMSVSSSPSSRSLPGLLASPGAIQMSYLASFFSILQWWNLVPDQTNVFVTAGKGTAFSNCGIADASGTVAADGYSTASITADKTLGVVYIPTGNTITVNMGAFAAGFKVNARWFDPTNGTYTLVAGSPFAATGSQVFAPPGKNSQGQADWVIVFQQGSPA